MALQSVHDGISNKNETLEHHAEELKRSDVRRRVFEEIYRGRKQPKTARTIAGALQIEAKTVNEHGLALIRAGMATDEKVGSKSGRVLKAYGRNDFCRKHKSKIISLAKNPNKLSKLPTKRRPFVNVIGPTVQVNFPKSFVDVRQLTIDDIDSFEKVRGVTSHSVSTGTISETDFKEGVRKIVGEEATFKDWGGETSDLMTTRVRFDGRRIAAAFAFKGPGLNTKLVPGKMGKNGDQCQRLFIEPVELFVVHHWREIDSSVLQLMKMLATAKSATEGRRIYYCIIDGQDSDRLIKAYPDAFK